MNQRLISVYQNIENQNKENFLNNKVEIDQTWGKEIWGITLQIDLGEEVRDQLTEYQKQLSILEPENLLLLPRSYQHISFNQVIFWGGNYKNGRQETWKSVSQEFLSKFKKLDNLFDSFKVTFSKLIATTGGIIWCGYDENNEMEKIRNDFLRLLPFPQETNKLNHIVHTTVARFKTKLKSPNQIIDFTINHKESVSMKVNKIILRNELIFPSIKTKDISFINLK